MDKFPLYLNGAAAGELTVTEEPMYITFRAICRPARPGLLRAYAVGEQGELRLGVLAPEGGAFVIRKRVSRQMVTPLGRLVRGEARPYAAEEIPWEPAPAPETLFRSPLLRERLRGVRPILTGEAQERRYVAVPYEQNRPFLLEELFCFARIARIEGRLYAVFAFDREERPVF